LGYGARAEPEAGRGRTGAGIEQGERGQRDGHGMTGTGDGGQNEKLKKRDENI